MICMVCHKHANFEHTLFRGTSPVPVRLCDACKGQVDADGHLAKIKGAPDKVAKKAAVEAFLTAVKK
jgi:hypothetical protein